jgi:hypothetical protein
MESKLADRIRALKLIVAAMAGGILGFSVIARVLIMNDWTAPGDENAQTLLLVLVLTATGALPVYFFFRSSVVNTLRAFWQTNSSHEGSVERIHRGFATLTIIGSGMVEGIGLFGAWIYLITANELGLLASGGAILMLMIMFPTQSSAERFTETITNQPA